MSAPSVTARGYASTTNTSWICSLCNVATFRKVTAAVTKGQVQSLFVGKIVEKHIKRITHADRVLRYLNSCYRPVSAYDILEALRSDGVSASTTVYRALEKLLEAGKVHRIESLNAWTVCCGGHDGKTPVFAICDDCGTVTEHIDNDFAHSIASLSARTGFAPNHFVLEIHGRCSDCDTGLSPH
jgi:Fur family transcriptional regulator, zinc uptake regulator